MPVSKIDPNVIFASDAPSIDKPPVFSDKTKGWDVARLNDGRPTIKEMNKVQQDTDLKILWLNENSVTPYDESINYPDGAVTLKDGSFKQLVSGAWVEFLDDFADKNEVKRGIANRYDSSLTYNSGERVVLANGDIVKSNISNNTNDPNVDMTGWIHEDYGLIKSFNSLAEIEQDPYDGQIIFIKTRNNESNGFFSGHFQFVADSVDTVDNGIILNANDGRWKRVYSTFIKAYWFGEPTGINDQVQINKAIAYGTANKQVVDLTGCVWGINGTVYAHGHVQIVASFNSYINVNSVGDYPNLWAFEFGDPSQGWTGGRAITAIEGYLYLNCNNRDNRLHGAYFKGSFHNLEHVRAYGFNGTGIKLESFHDSTFLRPTVEMCGNELDYSFVCDSPDDTSNCFNIVSLQCEQAQQRGIYISNTIRSTIQNIHAERLTVTNSSAVSNPLGKDYNHVMILSNSTVNQALFHANTGDINIRMDGSLSTYINVLAVGGRICGEFGNKTTYTDLECKDFIQAGVLRETTFNSLNCDRAVLTSNTALNNPKINYLDFQYQANAINFFGGEVNTVGDTSTSTTVTLGSINFFGTKIQNIYRTGFSDQNPPMIFNACPIINLVGDYQNVAIVQNCFVKNANLANEFKPKFVETNIETLNPTGSVGYLTRGGSIVTGTWSLPTISYPAGTVTERIGYDAAGKIYQNTADGVNWVKIA